MVQTKLRYGVWRRVDGHTESHNGEVTVNGQWGKVGFGRAAYEAVLAEEPGWLLAGYSVLEVIVAGERVCYVCEAPLVDTDSCLATCRAHTE